MKRALIYAIALTCFPLAAIAICATGRASMRKLWFAYWRQAQEASR